MNEILQLAWKRFTVITGIVGDIQGRAIVTVFYFTVFVPFGLGARLLGDALRLRPVETPSWSPREPVPTGLDDARRQG